MKRNSILTVTSTGINVDKSVYMTDTEILNWVIDHWETQMFGETFSGQRFDYKTFRELVMKEVASGDYEQ